MTAIGAAMITGTPSPISAAAVMPPITTNSPCAKFTTPDALWMRVKPSATAA